MFIAENKEAMSSKDAPCVPRHAAQVNPAASAAWADLDGSHMPTDSLPSSPNGNGWEPGPMFALHHLWLACPTGCCRLPSTPSLPPSFLPPSLPAPVWMTHSAPCPTLRQAAASPPSPLTASIRAPACSTHLICIRGGSPPFIPLVAVTVASRDISRHFMLVIVSPRNDQHASLKIFCHT